MVTREDLKSRKTLYIYDSSGELLMGSVIKVASSYYFTLVGDTDAKYIDDKMLEKLFLSVEDAEQLDLLN